MEYVIVLLIMLISCILGQLASCLIINHEAKTKAKHYAHGIPKSYRLPVPPVFQSGYQPDKDSKIPEPPYTGSGVEHYTK